MTALAERTLPPGETIIHGSLRWSFDRRCSYLRLWRMLIKKGHPLGLSVKHRLALLWLPDHVLMSYRILVRFIGPALAHRLLGMIGRESKLPLSCPNAVSFATNGGGVKVFDLDKNLVLSLFSDLGKHERYIRTVIPWQIAASAAGLAPKPLYFSQEPPSCVEELVSGRYPNDLHLGLTISRSHPFVRLVAGISRIAPLNQVLTTDYLKKTDIDEATLSPLLAKISGGDNTRPYFAALDKYRRRIQEGDVRDVLLAPTHGDLSLSNCLVLEDGSLIALDWEGCEYRSLFYDLYKIYVRPQAKVELVPNVLAAVCSEFSEDPRFAVKMQPADKPRLLWCYWNLFCMERLTWHARWRMERHLANRKVSFVPALRDVSRLALIESYIRRVLDVGT